MYPAHVFSGLVFEIKPCQDSSGFFFWHGSLENPESGYDQVSLGIKVRILHVSERILLESWRMLVRFLMVVLQCKGIKHSVLIEETEKPHVWSTWEFCFGKFVSADNVWLLAIADTFFAKIPNIVFASLRATSWYRCKSRSITEGKDKRKSVDSTWAHIIREEERETERERERERERDTGRARRPLRCCLNACTFPTHPRWKITLFAAQGILMSAQHWLVFVLDFQSWRVESEEDKSKLQSTQVELRGPTLPASHAI